MLGERPRPKSLVEAISDIQQHAAAERDGFPQPASYFLLAERAAFVEVGLKAGIAGMVANGCLQPVSLAVVDHLFPIFGTWTPTWFDQLIALLLGTSLQLAYALLVAVNLGPCYLGAWCREAIRMIYGGLIAGKVIMLIGWFWLYHALYLLLTPERIARWLENHSFLVQKLLMISADRAVYVGAWLLALKPLLLTSAWLLLALTLLSGALSGMVFLWIARRAVPPSIPGQLA
jgi:hypothetical protein